MNDIIDFKHLNKVKSGYWKHFRYGFYFSFLSLVAGVIGFVAYFYTILISIHAIRIIKHIQIEFAKQVNELKMDFDVLILALVILMAVALGHMLLRMNFHFKQNSKVVKEYYHINF